MSAGDHGLSFTRRGFDAVTIDLTAQPGDKRRLAPKFKISAQRVSSYGVLSLAASSAVVGGAFVGLTVNELHRAKSIEKKAADENISADERDAHDRAAARRDTYRGVAIGTIAGSAALGATGVLLYAFDHATPGAPRVSPGGRSRSHGDDEPIEISLTPAASPMFSGLTLDATF